MNTITQKAGAIILSNENKNNIALLYRGKQKDWSFPKGHIDAGEEPTQAMIREIKEETGLSIKILTSLNDLSYTSSTGEIVSTKMFLVQSEDDSTLKNESDNDSIEWVSYTDVISKLSYDNLREYYTNILPTIKSFITSE